MTARALRGSTIAALLAATACGASAKRGDERTRLSGPAPTHDPSSAPAAAAAPAPPPIQAGLRGIDWCNRRYGDRRPALSECRGEIEQRHRPGEGMWGTEEYRLVSVTYGDLTGDGREDALLLLETRLRPLIIGAHPPPVHASVSLIELRGSDLFEYTTETTDTPPTRVSIAKGVATFVWAEKATTCEEQWRFTGEGLSATKSVRRCNSATGAGPQGAH